MKTLFTEKGKGLKDGFNKAGLNCDTDFGPLPKPEDDLIGIGVKNPYEEGPDVIGLPPLPKVEVDLIGIDAKNPYDGPDIVMPPLPKGDDDLIGWREALLPKPRPPSVFRLPWSRRTAPHGNACARLVGGSKSNLELISMSK